MTGLESILESLDQRFAFDGNGRIVGSFSEGVLPRFVLGRAAEGCVWRFREGLPPELVAAVARLAAREPGAAFDGDLPAEPERLAAIERRLDEASSTDAAPGATTFATARAAIGAARRERELIVVGGIRLGELWRLA